MKRNGYANAQITDILQEAGLGTRAFYRHFSTKAELLVEVFRDNAARSRAIIEKRLAQSNDPVQQLLAWIDEMLDLAYDPRRRNRAQLFRSDAARAAFGDEGDRAIAELYKPLEPVLAAGVASGDFPHCDLENDAATIHAIVWRFFLPAVLGEPVADRPAARSCVLRFCLSALGLNYVPEQ